MNLRILEILALLLVLAPASIARAEEHKPAEPGHWKLGATVGLNASQSAFSSNWSGGDKGSIVWVLSSNVTAERQFTGAFHLANTLQLAYGQTARQSVDAADPRRSAWGRPDKTTDQISFESVGRFTLQSYVDPYLSLRLDSQFRDQSNPIGEIRFNPVKLKETAGVARVLEKTEDREAITRVGFGFRQTLAKGFADAVTRQRQSFTSNDGGFEWQTSVTRPLLGKKVLYKGSLLVFQPVFYSKSGPLKKFDQDARAADPTREAVAGFWKSPDIGFQNTFTAQITKHLSVNLFAQWVYDKLDAAANVNNALPLAAQIAEIDRNVRKAGQFKETLALGLTYQLF